MCRAPPGVQLLSLYSNANIKGVCFLRRKSEGISPVLYLDVAMPIIQVYINISALRVIMQMAVKTHTYTHTYMHMHTHIA